MASAEPYEWRSTWRLAASSIFAMTDVAVSTRHTFQQEVIQLSNAVLDGRTIVDW